ncbi:MAG: hypothetical protein BroJett025_10270 [Patescibacteria group bacterium]|nr:MAG: hypothetical protein BroJett025_10270 [Patescibacteria group bacterium]
MKRAWKYYSGVFAHENELDDILSGWYGLRKFGYDVVNYLEPKIIVELGTHKGTSFLSFCNSVRNNTLSTKLYAIDTWQGDSQTGLYVSEVLEKLKKIIKKHYSTQNIKLVKKSFNTAVTQFKNKKIDLLHIDGLHTYNAVKNDYNLWNKLTSENGLIIFHDIHCKNPGFGVHIFWSEIKKENYTLELKHSNGLGILFKNREVYEKLRPLESSWQAYYSTVAQLDYYKNFPKNKKSSLAKEYEEKLKTLEKVTIRRNNELIKENDALVKQLATINSSNIQKIAQKYYSTRKKIIGK